MNQMPTGAVTSGPMIISRSRSDRACQFSAGAGNRPSAAGRRHRSRRDAALVAWSPVCSGWRARGRSMIDIHVGQTLGPHSMRARGELRSACRGAQQTAGRGVARWAESRPGYGRPREDSPHGLQSHRPDRLSTSTPRSGTPRSATSPPTWLRTPPLAPPSTVRVWDAATGTPIGDPLTGHTGLVREVAFGQIEGQPVIASGGADQTVRVWDAGTGTPIGSVSHRHPAARLHHPASTSRPGSWQWTFTTEPVLLPARKWEW